MKGFLIFVLAIILYGVSVFGGFVQDDMKVIVNDPEMGEASSLVASFTRPYYYMDSGNTGAYRPLTSFSLYFNGLIIGKAAWGFRLLNILIYASVCWLVFEVLKKISSPNIAFWGSLIFLVLPIHTEAVNNIVGRAEVMSLGLVMLAGLLQFNKKWEISALVLLLALFSKETAIVGLPILMYLMIKGKEEKNTKIGVISFYVLVSICFVVLRMVILGNGGMENKATMVENPLKFVSIEERVRNAFALVPFGVSKVIFPLQLSYDYSFDQLKSVSNWFDWKVLLGISFVFLSISSLFTKLRKNILWMVGQAIFWGPIAITGNFIFPVGTIFGERLWFWSSLGIVMMGMVFGKRIFMNRRWVMGVLVVLIVILGGRTFIRNLDWLSQERLFVHDASYASGSVMAQSNAGAMYLMKKDLKKGKEYLERAERIYPKYPELMNNWGMYYLWNGEIEKAKLKFEECLIERPGYYLCESNIKLLK